MKERDVRILRMLAIALVAVLARPGLASAQEVEHKTKPVPPKKSASAATLRSAVAADPTSSWQLLTTQPPLLDYFDCGPGSPVLLTDGTVLVADNGCQDWWKLTPDQFGSYINGTWTQIASLPDGYSPLYHSTAVLPDGRVIIEGGEYNFSGGQFHAVWQARGAIYDPVADAWTPVAPPPFFGGFGPFPQTIGDAQGTVLSDGTYMQSDCCTKDEALLDPKTLTWTPTGSGKFGIHDEEGWTLLPNKKVLTVDAYVSGYDPTGMNFELYEPASGKWTSPGGGTKVQLWDSAADCGGFNVFSAEVGPAVLMADGSVFATGANSCGAAHTAIYKGSWKAGPDFPGDLGIADGPAALEPNGKVLMMASPLVFNTPSTFFEWDGTSLTVAPPAPNASNDSSFYGNMLILPTGQILFTDFFFVSVYNPAGTYNPAWQPTIQKAPSTVTPGGSYTISGHLFNGMSQGAAYGDDAQSATNYPIVRITNNATGHVFYSRTHDHSSMAVAFNGIVSTSFEVPGTQETGPSKLEVVANGIPSAPLSINVQ
jgi:hypothetical protein